MSKKWQKSQDFTEKNKKKPPTNFTPAQEL